MHSTNWEVFRGESELAPNRIAQLPPPPPWRQFRALMKADGELTDAQKQYQDKLADYWDRLQEKAQSERHSRDRLRGKSFRIRKDQSRVIQAVNAALALRRPLLVTGRPGSGKTSLAYAVAYELALGPVLMWPITARTTLEAGLYRYDAIARLQDAQLRKQKVEAGEDIPPEKSIGDYIQLGPLGTAFLPTPFPRVLLIDEIDKSDINLPNDLLNLLEEGQFEIAELVRLAEGTTEANITQVRTADDFGEELEGGQVRCDAFPLIVMTSNGERDFPPAFLRRCLRIEMPKPAEEDLFKIVEAHLTQEVADEVKDLVGRFFQKTDSEAALLATDQLLNAVYLRKYGAAVDPDDDLEQLLLAALTSSGLGSGG
ncbi:AAA family ATPase [cf. Phormidesmis sp. LEGE 11477]|nr:AAA family ATPase [cf. Phormidesmis sp. LEGE 11477]